MSGLPRRLPGPPIIMPAIILFGSRPTQGDPNSKFNHAATVVEHYNIIYVPLDLLVGSHGLQNKNEHNGQSLVFPTTRVLRHTIPEGYPTNLDVFRDRVSTAAVIAYCYRVREAEPIPSHRARAIVTLKQQLQSWLR